MKSFLKRVLITTLIAGTLDLFSAYVQLYVMTHQVSKTLLNYIAGGAMGLENSMKGGAGVGFLGALIHYFIAFLFTLFFFLIYRKLKLESFNKYVTGIVYGLFVWFVMNIIVVPFSLLPPRPFHLNNSIIAALILICMIGLPVSISASDYFKKSSV